MWIYDPLGNLQLTRILESVEEKLLRVEKLLGQRTRGYLENRILPPAPIPMEGLWGTLRTSEGNPVESQGGKSTTRKRTAGQDRGLDMPTPPVFPPLQLKGMESRGQLTEPFPSASSSQLG